jgi:hypothetical protein
MNSKEIILHCPLYTKSLTDCPSHEQTPHVLRTKELEKLLKSCTSEKYKKCTVYLSYQEKAA